MSWPVPNTLMVEPTESEPMSEVDRFCDAMISIAKEIDEVKNGNWSKEDNPVINAPHTVETLTQENWSHPYSRQIALANLSEPICFLSTLMFNNLFKLRFFNSLQLVLKYNLK